MESARTTTNRPSRRRLTALTVACLVPLAGLSACSGGNNSSSKQTVTKVTFGTIAAPPTLNPATGDPAYGSLYQWAYDPLVVLKPDGTFGPGLATKWGYVGAGNKSYELTIRTGVKFSDGTPLDAQAVKTFLDYERAQKAGSVPGLVSTIDSIEATDATTVRISLKVPTPGLTFNFAQAFGAGNIASPKAVAAPATLNTTTVGAGPYMLDPKQTVANDHYTFVKNPYYWNKDAQHFEQVTVRVIANPSSMVQAMRSGQIQAALGDATTLTAARSAGLTVVAPPQAMSGINFLDRTGAVSKPLGDVRVRQALNYAIDRKAIAKALYGSEDLALDQYALPGQAGYVSTETYPYDTDKAKQLLADAGYPKGFTLNVLTTNLAGLDKLVQAIGGQLQGVGVKLNLTSKASVNDYVVAMLSGKYPAAAIGYGLANMASLYVGFVNVAGPFNPMKYKDAQLDALYGQYFAASDQDGMALEKQINQRLIDQAWSLPVVGAPLSYYLAKGFTGLDATSQNSGVPRLTELRAS